MIWPIRDRVHQLNDVNRETINNVRNIGLMKNSVHYRHYVVKTHLKNTWILGNHMVLQYLAQTDLH
jgi:hypothetical protein